VMTEVLRFVLFHGCLIGVPPGGVVWFVFSNLRCRKPTHITKQRRYR
jgi:hypothetical protein